MKLSKGKFVRKRVYSFTVHWGNGSWVESRELIRDTQGLGTTSDERQFRDKIGSMTGFTKKFWFSYYYCQKYGVKFFYEKKIFNQPKEY